MQAVKWGEFRLGDLFESGNGNYDIQKEHINGTGDYVITAGLSNNGILGKTDVPAKIFEENTITVDMFGFAFYRQFEYKMVTHARVFSLKPKFETTTNQGLFLSSAFHFIHKKFGYENMCSWAKINSEKIQLPILNNNQIDFEFMEIFIAELEAQRIAELEAYLLVTGLKDYILTTEEQQVLDDFTNGKFILEIFKIGMVLEKLNLKNHSKSFDKCQDTSTIRTDEFSLPLVNAKLGNNGIMFYGREEDFDSAEMTIDVVSNGAVATGSVYAQPYKTGVLWDAYLLKPIAKIIHKESLLYLSASLEKAIKTKFGWEDKAVWSKVQHEYILLPTKDNQPDYEMMETFISAIQKLVIKDVVLYAWKKYK